MKYAIGQGQLFRVIIASVNIESIRKVNKKFLGFDPFNSLFSSVHILLKNITEKKLNVIVYSPSLIVLGVLSSGGLVDLFKSTKIREWQGSYNNQT